MIDVGPNIGIHAIFLAQCCAAIPNPTSVLRLDSNIAANRLTNVFIHRAGLRERDGIAVFREKIAGNPCNCGSASGAGEALAGNRKINPPIRYADRAVSGVGRDRMHDIQIDAAELGELAIAALAGPSRSTGRW